MITRTRAQGLYVLALVMFTLTASAHQEIIDDTRTPLPKRETVITKGRYQHYKGFYYEVLDVARHSETLEDMVVYRALYGDYGLWIRPLAMFLESVEIEGVEMPRFTLIEEKQA